jgi:hypothetical protein
MKTVCLVTQSSWRMNASCEVDLNKVDTMMDKGIRSIDELYNLCSVHLLSCWISYSHLIPSCSFVTIRDNDDGRRSEQKRHARLVSIATSYQLIKTDEEDVRGNINLRTDYSGISDGNIVSIDLLYNLCPLRALQCRVYNSN